MQSTFAWLPGLCTIILCVGCNSSIVHDVNELSAYVSDKDNGLTYERYKNGLKMRVTYKPTEQMVYEELRDEILTPDRVSELTEKYDKFHYVVFSLSSGSKEVLHDEKLSIEHYGDLVQTLSFQMGEFVQLVTPSDTIPVFDFALNRTFGLSQSTDLLFAFSSEKTKDAPWIDFYVEEFGFGFEKQGFRFRREDLASIPIIEP